MKALYSLRSDLVHRGERSANIVSANQVQWISEECYRIVLGRADLEMKFKDFIVGLKQASFGDVWPSPRYEPS
jgi:hypothetical protein